MDNEPVNGESSDSSNENVDKDIITNNEIVNKFCGLENIEHYCSIISLIQVLFHIPPFKETIINCDIPFPDDDIIIVLKTAFQYMSRRDDEEDMLVVDPNNIIQALKNANGQVNDLDVNDVLSILFKMILNSQFDKALLCFRISRKTEIWDKEIIDFIDSRVEKLYILTIEQDEGSSVQDKLKKLELQSHIESDKNMISSFLYLPRILIISINRVDFNDVFKISEKRIANFLINDEISVYNNFERGKHEYVLFGTIVHIGEFSHNGHYITLIRFLVGDNFAYFRFDDETVTQISEDDFFHYSIGDDDINSCATMLFYIKKHLFSEFAKF